LRAGRLRSRRIEWKSFSDEHKKHRPEGAEGARKSFSASIRHKKAGLASGPPRKTRKQSALAASRAGRAAAVAAGGLISLNAAPPVAATIGSR